jgi:DNA-binding transcriptional ArsR family regulator
MPVNNHLIWSLLFGSVAIFAGNAADSALGAALFLGYLGEIMLRMVFEPQDLQRVRLAGEADPMWELVLSLQKAQSRCVPTPFVGWRQAVGHSVAGGRPGPVWPMAGLVAARGDFPDFLTPPGLVADIDAGCELVAATSRGRLATDLHATFRRRPAHQWVRTLASGDREPFGELLRAVRTGHDLLVAPYWAEVREAVAADRARRARDLADRGVGALLRNLPGVLGWDGRVLELGYPEDRTVYLAGRGLVLLPCYFCWGNPVTWIDPELPPVLVYQARDPSTQDREAIVPKGVATLLGGTRAECLRLLLRPRSTSELAEHLGTSTGTASKQATVLRNAGLITSSRRGTSMQHLVTPLGVALLTGRA